MPHRSRVVPDGARIAALDSKMLAVRADTSPLAPASLRSGEKRRRNGDPKQDNAHEAHGHQLLDVHSLSLPILNRSAYYLYNIKLTVTSR